MPSHSDFSSAIRRALLPSLFLKNCTKYPPDSQPARDDSVRTNPFRFRTCICFGKLSRRITPRIDNPKPKSKVKWAVRACPLAIAGRMPQTFVLLGYAVQESQCPSKSPCIIQGRYLRRLDG